MEADEDKTERNVAIIYADDRHNASGLSGHGQKKDDMNHYYTGCDVMAAIFICVDGSNRQPRSK